MPIIDGSFSDEKSMAFIEKLIELKSDFLYGLKRAHKAEPGVEPDLKTDIELFNGHLHLFELRNIKTYDFIVTQLYSLKGEKIKISVLTNQKDPTTLFARYLEKLSGIGYQRLIEAKSIYNKTKLTEEEYTEICNLLYFADFNFIIEDTHMKNDIVSIIKTVEYQVENFGIDMFFIEDFSYLYTPNLQFPEKDNAYSVARELQILANKYDIVIMAFDRTRVLDKLKVDDLQCGKPVITGII